MSDSVMVTEEVQDDLLGRGFGRRDLARIAAVFGVGAAAATLGRPAWASGGVPDPAPTARVRIGANECWTGPFMPGQKAAAAIIASGNRYSPHDERGDFIKAVMAVENVPYDHVAPWPGSSDPLSRAVVTFCSPGRGLVTADPTFELAGRTAQWLKVPVKAVPLTKDYTHDVKAMLAADPNAGLYYICTPNNPTGTITPLADIEWLLDNKPADAVVLIDEAYTHFAGVPTASYLAPKRKDVIVMRTFSKIFGMAGMRMGFIMTNPDNLMKMMRYDGGMQSGALPLPSLACATASLTAAPLIVQRRAEMRTARGLTLDHLKKYKGIEVKPTEANMFMIDWKTKPARDVQAAFRKESIEIGRSWPIWPTVSRITVGSAAEMKDFCTALDKIMA
ncbi:aminotransferase class I/II-fold pyridoxal phosphate-dependent enzyme [Sphingomonas populi]|uniref:Aminotransferase class I/II-fold pyridoxal phosphate-dependent enzyme n=1 Tax=Sphingomonas populi TaxID=2484750 RepID=A0A4Q6XLX3_9SPHN|nr:pyridoxal phosphate-dependent aminotransferase [Sphingomonas populi]RZF61003.1 aminotransferase class I/II-fold pyridoxal phosphate-dependent enzyme [Sphingomonas populi]